MPSLLDLTLRELLSMTPQQLFVLASRLNLLEWSIVLCIPAATVAVVASLGLHWTWTTYIISSLASIFFLIVCGLAGSRISIGVAGWVLFVLLVNVFSKEGIRAQMK